MNTSDLVNEVSKVTCTKKEAKEAVKTVIETITGTLKNKGTVRLAGFGSFSITKRSARMGKNPRTGKEIVIKAKNVPKFKPGKALKDAVK